MTSTQPGTVLVTGASSEFGEAITRRFAAEGARVVAAARRSDRVSDLVAELGPRVHPLTLDVRDRAAVAAAVAGLAARVRRDRPAGEQRLASRSASTRPRTPIWTTGTR